VRTDTLIVSVSLQVIAAVKIGWHAVLGTANDHSSRALADVNLQMDVSWPGQVHIPGRGQVIRSLFDLGVVGLGPIVGTFIQRDPLVPVQQAVCGVDASMIVSTSRLALALGRFVDLTVMGVRLALLLFTEWRVGSIIGFHT